LRTIGIAFIAVTLLIPWTAAFAQTATGAMPSETTAARRYIQEGLAAIFASTSDESFRVEKADIGRAKACAVQALMADMPDDVAEELVVQLKDSSVRNAQFVTYWLMPESTDVQRRNQVDARMAEICPELFAASVKP
jgi:hypothetical protein